MTKALGNAFGAAIVFFGYAGLALAISGEITRGDILISLIASVLALGCNQN